MNKKLRKQILDYESQHGDFLFRGERFLNVLDEEEREDERARLKADVEKEVQKRVKYAPHCQLYTCIHLLMPPPSDATTITGFKNAKQERLCQTKILQKSQRL